ncbi:MAG TPA: hypothetical protein VJB67_00300 [Patescibacteria group bacterium]|nr:hypothetical protein [Patescibacteria group bacterium]
MANLEKIVNLLKKTGDKAIILDQNGNPCYVIMTLPDYENLVLGHSGVMGLTEDELLAKINREIEIWKDTQEINDLPVDQYDFSQNLGDFSPDEIGEIEVENAGENEDGDRFYFEPVE